jgi:hypothetical protein
MWENDNDETEAALDALEKAMLPATLAERERCPTCGKWLDDHGGKWCACPTCKKPFEPAHGCKAGDYPEERDTVLNGPFCDTSGQGSSAAWSSMSIKNFPARAARRLVLDVDQKLSGQGKLVAWFWFNSAETKQSVLLCWPVVRWLTVAGRSVSPFSARCKSYPF